MLSIIQRLKERKLVQWGLAYSAGAFGVLQLMDALEGPLGLSRGVQLTLVGAVLLGLPVALLVAWYHDPEPDAPSVALQSRSVDSVRKAASTKSIVVLPFGNLSPDPGDRYFGDGLTDEVISDLSKLSGLRVISRQSAMMLKGTKKDVRTIARDLGVSHVLTGSVRRAGDTLRITAELADGATESLVWSDRYTGTMAEVFEFQERLSREIVDALQVLVTPEESERLAAQPITDVKAYERYLMAREAFLRFTPDGFARAEGLLSLGLEDAPDNALLLATKAFFLQASQHNSLAPVPGWQQEAERLARRALDLDPHCAVAHEALGISSGYLEGDIAAAIRGFRRAHELEPGNSSPLVWLVDLYSYLGRSEPAIEVARQAMSLDPWSWIVHARLCLAYLWAGQPDRCFEETERLVARHGGQSHPDFHTAHMMFRQGRVDEARALVQAWRPKLPSDPFWRLGTLYERAFAGDHNGALAAATPAFEAWARGGAVYSWLAAGGYAVLGATDTALDMLTRAADLGFINHPFLAEHDVFLKPLWDDPRGAALLERLRRELESFES